MRNREDFKEYEKAFLTQNSYLNLISKNDEKFLWEKHIFDSLAIEKFFEKYFFEDKRFGGQGDRQCTEEQMSRGQEDKLFNHNDCKTARLQDCMSVNNSSISEIPQKQQTDKDLSPYRPNAISPSDSHTSIHPYLYTSNLTLLDIGTGGGFPAVPIALSYPAIEVYALDSIRKKINAIENIKAELGLKNLHTICDRAENIIEGKRVRRLEGKPFNNSSLNRILQQQQTDKSLSTFQPFNHSTDNNFQLSTFNFQFDIITSRAVAPIKVIAEYAMPLLKDDGYFIAYKSLKAQEEINDAKPVLKKYKAKVADIIQYNLPLEENYTRNLVVISKM